MIVERVAAHHRRKPGPGPRPARLLGLGVLTALVPVMGCAGRFDPAHQDVILVVGDTLRADHLGVYGYDRGTSPRVDGLARRRPLVGAARASAPRARASVAPIMTARRRP